MANAEFIIFEPLYPGASIAKWGAYYSIMLYAHKFKISNKAIHGLTKLLHLFCPSPNSLPKSDYNIFQAILCSLQTPEYYSVRNQNSLSDVWTGCIIQEQMSGTRDNIISGGTKNNPCRYSSLASPS